ncbi:hypothetical protein T439DRAFT_15289 [Meredithblackwellia eburnea MCA 4105]
MRRMVQDPSLESYIAWEAEGKAFSVFNPTEFSKDILPQFFKHQNFQSFVRQVSDPPKTLRMHAPHRLTSYPPTGS